MVMAQLRAAAAGEKADFDTDLIDASAGSDGADSAAGGAFGGGAAAGSAGATGGAASVSGSSMLQPFGSQRVVKLIVSATLTHDPSKLARLALHCPRSGDLDV